MADEIGQMTTKDLQQTLVLILDNLGRQKALQALEIYREHEKFKSKLEGIEKDVQDKVKRTATQSAAAAAKEQVEDYLNQAFKEEDEKREKEKEKMKKQLYRP